MSPELRASFEASWPALNQRLQRMLIRHRVPGAAREDLAQETAIRLLGVWSRLDPRADLWPLTATIALNLLRDAARANRAAPLFRPLAEADALGDVESAGLARVELAEVMRAAARLTPTQREALFSEFAGNLEPSTPAQKMARMRARKRLRALIESAPVVVGLRVRRLADIVGPLVSRDALAPALACIACVAAIAAPWSPVFTPEAGAAPAPRHAREGHGGGIRGLTVNAHEPTTFLRDAAAPDEGRPQGKARGVVAGAKDEDTTSAGAGAPGTPGTSAGDTAPTDDGPSLVSGSPIGDGEVTATNLGDAPPAPALPETEPPKTPAPPEVTPPAAPVSAQLPAPSVPDTDVPLP